MRTGQSDLKTLCTQAARARALPVIGCLAAFAVAPTVLAGQAGPFVLVPKSRLWAAPPETILVLRDGASYLERWAASEFVGYVHRATTSRVLLPQAYGGVPTGWSGLAIMWGVAGRRPFEEVDPAKMPTHGFHIRTEPERLLVVGASEQGASNALFWLLREKVGVRWYMPTRLGEEVPVHEQIVLEPMDVTLGPDIPSRSVDTRHYGTTGNRTSRGRRRDSMTRHIWDEVVRPTERNRREHPEWFALTDREKLPDKDWMLKFLWLDQQGRVRSNQLCTTRPDVLRMFAGAALRQFRENPNARMFSVSPNDYHEFCTCPDCQALDDELGKGPLSNRLVHFFNKIAAEVRKEFPDRRLGFTAYSSHVDPPTTVKPDPMIWPSLCFFGSRACYQHPIDDPTCPVNRAWKETVFDGWTKLCPEFGYYSYYAYAGTGWAGPQMLIRTLPRDLRLARDRGCTYFHVDGWSNWATNAPMNYLIRRLPWDVDADPAAILDEWYSGVYGPASAPMKQYWERLADGRYKVAHSPSKPRTVERMFTRELIARARGHLEAAEEATASAHDRYRRRVAIARAGLEYTDAMALAYGHAAGGRYGQAVEAGERALKVIVDTRALEPAPYYTPLFPRDRQTWVWYRSWDGRNSAEKMTEAVIEGWRTAIGKAAPPPPPGRVLVRLPETWSFRKDEEGVGEQQRWFADAVPGQAWTPISTHVSWTHQPFPGNWHGTGWYRLDVSLDAPDEGQLFLHFGAIDGWATVWINDVQVGKHDLPPEKMWNKPWSVSISEAATRPGINRIAVRVRKDKYAAGIYRPSEIRIAP